MFLKLAKRLSKQQKEEIKQIFIEGESIDNIAKKFKFSKLTIIRNLKKIIGESKFEDIVKNTNSNINLMDENKKNEPEFINLAENKVINNVNSANIETLFDASDETDLHKITEFIEIPLLNEEIDNAIRKDFSSIPLSEIEFPNTVFMIVDKKIELEIKLLKHFPEWHYLPQEDLNRKTIKIYYDLKNAKSACNKDQKVIKVPNTNVFKLASRFLINRGITRIISENHLIAL